MRYMKTGGGLPPGLAALAKERPDVVKKMGYDVAMDGTKLAAISKKLGISPETAKKLATIGMKAMKNGGVVGGAPVLSAEDGARMYLFGGLKQKFQDFSEKRPVLAKGLGMGLGFLAGGAGGATLAGYMIDKNRERKAALEDENPTTQPDEPLAPATEMDPMEPAEPMQPVDTAIEPVESTPVVGASGRVYKFGGKYADQGTKNGDDKNGDEKEKDTYSITVYEKVKQGSYPEQLQRIYGRSDGPVIDRDSKSLSLEIPNVGSLNESINAFMKENPDIKGYVDTPFREEDLNNPDYIARGREMYTPKPMQGMRGQSRSFYVPFQMVGLKAPGAAGQNNKNWEANLFQQGSWDVKEKPQDMETIIPRPPSQITPDKPEMKLLKKETPMRPPLERMDMDMGIEPERPFTTAAYYQGGDPDYQKMVDAIHLNKDTEVDQTSQNAFGMTFPREFGYGGKNKMKLLKMYGGYAK
ncbi:MAG: hypothetical protein NWE77_06740 [Candidatus Bathyarchaeota archaeon]|nr:hypothetical protein [Candidatus Bathyarchaeota archaeon]